jgi:multidrug efflux pump subunit AcrA (membrane-fusion protein)
MLAEVHVPNRGGGLLPGMFVYVTVTAPRPEPPLLVDSEAIQVRADGIYVAVVGDDQKAHQRKVVVGTDFGKQIEILSGVEEGALLIVNPSDAIREGVPVKPVRPEEGGKGGKR